ncbi:lycopene cyclase domain-containing protein [Microbacterium sp. NPDC058342]|uniref:lycopene cyclase domain-containing protein n=1 Tax=Microbacterium sp. NPDC058342 TaxID=3346454 RepID=UPI0036491BA2
MTYLLLCAGFLLLAVIAATVLRRPGGPSSGALAIAAAALILLTAVFDNLMIAAGLFSYADSHVSGLRIGAAPIEDFAYPLAAVILLPALWSRLTTARSADDRVVEGGEE